MEPSATFISAANITSAEQIRLPRDCTFLPSDWLVLASFWHPVAFSQKITDKPYGTRLLDERLVIYRISDGSVRAAKDLCFHRGAPLSLGCMEGDEIVCPYHGLRYNSEGQCTRIPAHPKGAVSPRLRLEMYRAQEAYGLVWVQLVPSEHELPEFPEWNNTDYIQVLPDSLHMNAAAGRQVEGFLDVSHFAFVHTDSFGEPDNP